MRITQNQIVNRPVQADSTKTEQNSNVVGKTIEGVITAVNGNKITLSQNGQLLNLINDSARAFEANQKVQLIITGSKEGTLTAVPLNSNVQEDLSGQALTKFGVLSDSVNREIADAMIKYDVPLTKENFNTMKQNLTAAKAFINDIQMSPDKAALIDVGKSLKENVLNFIKNESGVQSNSPSATQNENGTGMKSPDATLEGKTNLEVKLEMQDAKLDGLSNKADVQESKSGMTEAKLDALSNKTDTLGIKPNQVEDSKGVTLNLADKNIAGDIKGADPSIHEHTAEQAGQNTQGMQDAKIQEAIAKSLMKDLVNAFGDKPVEEFHEVVNKLVNLFNLEEDAVFTKHDLELNLNNLLVMNQLKFTEKSVGGSFFELSKVIGKSNLSEEDLMMLQDILKEEMNEEEKLNKVAGFLKSISENVDTKEKIDKEVFFIKDASQMTKQLNEPLFYMQIPFKMEAYERPVDIYYRRKKSNDDKEDFTILIALKTNRYQEVKCVIEKKKDLFVLNFKLANEEIKNIFESRSKELEQQLSEKSIVLKFTTQSEEIDSILEVPKQGSIDMKV